MPEEEPLVPKFIQDAVETGPIDPVTQKPYWTTNLRDLWWAEQETAAALAVRYHAAAVQMPPYYPARWFRVSFTPDAMWYLQFPNGTLINAGILADYFRRNPEAEHPGVADKYVRDYITAAMAGL